MFSVIDFDELDAESLLNVPVSYLDDQATEAGSLADDNDNTERGSLALSEFSDEWFDHLNDGSSVASEPIDFASWEQSTPSTVTVLPQPCCERVRTHASAHYQKDIAMDFLVEHDDQTVEFIRTEDPEKTKDDFVRLHDKSTPGRIKWECCFRGCKHKTRRFSETDKIKSHIKRVHIGCTKVMCPNCNKEISDKHNLKRHLNLCTGYSKRQKQSR